MPLPDALPAKAAVTLAALVLWTSWLSPAAAEPAGAVMLVHGNYCGLGNNAPLPPVDALDEACARHDACIPDEGLPSKACHARLEEEAHALSLDPAQPGPLRLMASLVTAFAATAVHKPATDIATVNVKTLPPTTWTILK